MPAHPEQHFRWTWELASTPEALWPLVSDTDRFNRDCGYPSVTVIPAPSARAALLTNSRRIRVSVLGVIVEWDELAFEWLAPSRFAVDRTYHSGPVAHMVMSCELHLRAGGGTTLIYDMRLTPSSWLGRLGLPFIIGKKARATTERVFRKYDEFAQKGLLRSQLAQKPQLARGGEARLAAISRTLIEQASQPAPLVEKLKMFITNADDPAAARIRPYALADEWHADRRETLKLFLHATRSGLLDFSWDLVCPHCRGAKARQPSLATLKPVAHCDSCHIDFTANFDQSVELTFTTNASVRAITPIEYCVGGPQVTPHVVAQQTLGKGETRTLPFAFAPGRYRVRTPLLAMQHAFRIEPNANAKASRVDLNATSLSEPIVAPEGELTIVNATDREHLAIVEHLAWSDASTTAAEVTSLQVFRDLFSREVLRRGEQISVRAMTVVFTDLKNSTQLYQEIGDAPAFGRVLTHFEILKTAVAAQDGCIVKTMGDAIMAVFPRPVAAVRAILHAQQWLAQPGDFALPHGLEVPPSSLKPLTLKASIHSGPCLAINQNDRLDYFGSTVNITARLCALSSGTDVILSSAVHADAEVASCLAASDTSRSASQELVKLKGFGDFGFEIWRLSPL